MSTEKIYYPLQWPNPKRTSITDPPLLYGYTNNEILAKRIRAFREKNFDYNASRLIDPNEARYEKRKNDPQNVVSESGEWGPEYLINEVWPLLDEEENSWLEWEKARFVVYQLDGEGNMEKRPGTYE